MLDIPTELWPSHGPCGTDKSTAKTLYSLSSYFCEYLKDHTGLVPSSDVLEIGFGSGRTARVLWDYLTPDGSYSGIDIVKRMVDWHADNITPLRPNARFFHANVKNAVYSNAGVVPAEYVFPFADCSFDVIFLVSVFTHMFPSDVANYLREINRMLRPGGFVLATCFLIDDQVMDSMAAGTARHNMRPLVGHLHTWTGASKPAPAEGCIGHSVDNHRAAYESAGLSLVQFWEPGTWSKSDRRGNPIQDMVVAQRPREEKDV